MGPEMHTIHTKNGIMFQIMTKKYIFDYFYRIVIWHICRVKQIPFFDAHFSAPCGLLLDNNKKKTWILARIRMFFYIPSKYVSVSIQGLRYCF